MIYSKPKEVKEIVTPLYIENWKDEHMQQYCIKKASVAAVLSNDKVYVIEKPSIQKDFCFGYGMNAQATDEEISDAENMAEHARNDIKYFLDENLKGINNWIKALKNHKEDIENYGYSNHPVMYCPQYGNSKSNLIGLSSIKLYDVDNYKNQGHKELSKEDTEIIIQAYEQAKSIFIKRLEKYLSKYGLSNLNVWTYQID